jgi:hypothetical protein
MEGVERMRTLNEVVRDIFIAVATYGSMNAARAWLSSWAPPAVRARTSRFRATWTVA